MSPSVPPMTYKNPSSTAADAPERCWSIGAILVQVSSTGSYLNKIIRFDQKHNKEETNVIYSKWSYETKYITSAFLNTNCAVIKLIFVYTMDNTLSLYGMFYKKCFIFFITCLHVASVKYLSTMLVQTVPSNPPRAYMSPSISTTHTPLRGLLRDATSLLHRFVFGSYLVKN